MTRSYSLRAVLLLSALLFVAALTLWAVQRAWTKIGSLERRLTAGQLESFNLADEFQGRLHKLNSTMLLFEARREPATLAEFQEAGASLNDWIDQHDPQLNKASNLSSEEERSLFHKINEVYDDYLRAANGVFSNQQPALVSAEAFAHVGQVGLESDRLFTLGSKLAEAHRRAQESFLSDSDRDLAGLRALLTTDVIVMLGLVSALGLVLYRDLVKPLRVRLVQSEVILERQGKLATLGTLAAGIAHEIRNPLTSIKARLYTLDKHIKANPAGLADAKVIGSEIARLERIVQDVLSFARPSEPNAVATPADAPLREVHTLMASSLERSSVRLLLEPSNRVFVSIDTALIKQVLINLIRNAAEAIEGGGTITLRVRADRATLEGVSRPVAILEVADTGKGIPPEVEARLFDPFFTTKEAGTGLGLSIAARIIEKHGGLLQYQTQVGRGTTFGIVLPAVSCETEIAPQRAA